MIKLTENITLEELTASTEAAEHGIINMPDEYALQNLTVLAKRVLQPVRDHFQRPIVIGPQHSGYRCEELNDLVGGESTSQHMKGEAADFHVQGISLKDVFFFILNNLEFDQLIYEDGRWLHCSYRTGKNRKDVLVGKIIYGRMRYSHYKSEEQLS